MWLNFHVRIKWLSHNPKFPWIFKVPSFFLFFCRRSPTTLDFLATLSRAPLPSHKMADSNQHRFPSWGLSCESKSVKNKEIGGLIVSKSSAALNRLSQEMIILPSELGSVAVLASASCDSAFTAGDQSISRTLFKLRGQRIWWFDGCWLVCMSVRLRAFLSVSLFAHSVRLFVLFFSARSLMWFVRSAASSLRCVWMTVQQPSQRETQDMQEIRINTGHCCCWSTTQ